MRTGYDLIAIAAERTPDHPALVDDRTDRVLTYSQLMAAADAVAAGLYARGVAQGHRVATALPNDVTPPRRRPHSAASNGYIRADPGPAS